MANAEHQPRLAPTPGCSFVARTAFTYGDRSFAAGDPFPYAELGMTEDGAWNFWRSAMIVVAPEPVAAPQPAPQTKARHTLHDAKATVDLQKFPRHLSRR